MTKSNQERAPNHKATVFESIIIGSVATTTEVMIDHPLWTLKTIQQAADQSQPVRAIEVAKKIYSTQGGAGFFKGGFWRGARVASAITIIGAVKEKMEAEFCNQDANTSFKR